MIDWRTEKEKSNDIPIKKVIEFLKQKGEIMVTMDSIRYEAESQYNYERERMPTHPSAMEFFDLKRSGTMLPYNYEDAVRYQVWCWFGMNKDTMPHIVFDYEKAVVRMKMLSLKGDN